MTAMTGMRAFFLKRSSSLNMMSDAVTVPPVLLIRTISALTLGSSSAFLSSSRRRTRSGTRGGGAPMTRVGDEPSSLMNPGMSVKRIFARPEPSTVRSSRGLIRGVRSIETSEQPAASRTSKRKIARDRMPAVYPAGLNGVPALWDNRWVTPDLQLTLDDVRGAAQRLANRIYRTPVIASQPFDDASGCRVFFKCENLQIAGSFKIRGALNKLRSLTAAERSRGVIAYSSGNHAQGVALAAQMVGTSAIICMPTDAPALKVEATRGYGAEIVFYDRLKDDRAAVARRLADETGRVLVPPYDDPAIMAGQGTAALELFEEVPALDALVTPVGGGGLMAGCSTVARSLSPQITIVGVEADTANDTYLSLQKGERVTIPPPPTIADGIRPQSPGELTFPILRENLSAVALVSDAEIIAAVRFLALRTRVVVEPTGAVGAAAVLTRKLAVPAGARIGVVLSGGNLDPDLLIRILRGELSGSGVSAG